MLDSMIRNPRPTRAEVSDVANAIYDGTSAVMLSGETANGKYPVEALKMMVQIAEQTEASIDYWYQFSKSKPSMMPSVANAISHATCTTAMDLNAKAIVTVTHGGRTARQISRFRPASPIVAGTLFPRAQRQLTGSVTAVHRVSARSERLAGLTAIRCGTGLLTVNDVGCDREDRLCRAGVTIALVLAEVLHELTDDLSCDTVNLRVVVTVLRVVAGDLEVNCQAHLVSDRDRVYDRE